MADRKESSRPDRSASGGGKDERSDSERAMNAGERGMQRDPRVQHDDGTGGAHGRGRVDDTASKPA